MKLIQKHYEKCLMSLNQMILQPRKRKGGKEKVTKEEFLKEFEKFKTARNMLSGLTFIHSNSIYGSGGIGSDVERSRKELLDDLDKKASEIKEKKEKLKTICNSLLEHGEKIEEEIVWTLNR